MCALLPVFNLPCSMSQCFFFCIFWSKFVALLRKINLCTQKNRQISTEVTWQYLNTVARLDSICSGSCKACPCNYLFTAVTALYDHGFLWNVTQLLCTLQEQMHSILYFLCNIHEFNQSQAKCFPSFLIDCNIVLKCALIAAQFL